MLRTSSETEAVNCTHDPDRLLNIFYSVAIAQSGTRRSIALLHRPRSDDHPNRPRWNRVSPSGRMAAWIEPERGSALARNERARQGIWVAERQRLCLLAVLFFCVQQMI